jgi:predicted small metal-binding protein
VDSLARDIVAAPAPAGRKRRGEPSQGGAESLATAPGRRLGAGREAEEENAMKDFHCRDAGMSCDFIAKGATADEVLAKAGEHAAKVHHLEVSKDLARKVTSLIHDETSPEHARSMSLR